MNDLPFKEMQNENSRSCYVDASRDVGWTIPRLHGAVVANCLAALSFNCLVG